MEMPPTRPIRLALCLTLLAPIVAGCQPKSTQYPVYQPSTQPVTGAGLTDSSRLAKVDALVAPPAGWQTEDPKTDEDHVHLSWKSPSGKTNYGVIYFSLPLPFSASWIYNPYLAAMRKSEGEANVIAGPVDDKALPGLRFTVECGDYRMRTNLICKGFHGWAVYAGTLRKEDEVPAELELAERARERTKVGVAASGGAVTRPTASVAE
jgi:hypothetical protein